MDDSLAIIVPNSYSGPNVGYRVPVSRGVRSVFFPRVNAATAVANKVDPLSGGVGNAAIVGAPTFGAGSATLKGGANYMQTASSDAATSTILLVARNLDTLADLAHTPGVAGNLALGASGYGATFALIAGVPSFVARRVMLVGGTTPTNSGSAKSVVTNNVWAFLAVTFDNTNLNVGGRGVGITTFNLTTGETPNFTPTTSPPIAGSSNVKIGGLNSIYLGNCEIAFAAEHNVCLTDAEIGLWYAAVKKKLGLYTTPIVV